MLIRNQRSFAAGALFLIVAVFYFFMSFKYATGTPARMGPGFFPRMVSIIFGLIAAGILLSGITHKAKIEKLERWDLKGLLWIAGSVALFGLLLPTFGLVIALSILIVIASLASPEFGWRGALINTVVLVVFCVGVFIYG